MAMSDEQFADLDKMIQKARQKPINYGVSLGKKPQDNMMICDLRKPPETLMRKAKAEGETPKVTFGTIEVKGKIITMEVQGKMLPGLAKNMKQFMLKTGRKFKVEIVDPEGNLLESDGDENLEDDDGTLDDGQTEELADQAPDTAADTEDDTAEDAAQESDDPLAPQWTKIHEKVDPMVRQFAGSGDPRGPKVEAAWGGALNAANEGNFKGAIDVAKKLAPIVSAAPTAATTSDAAATETATTETGNEGNEAPDQDALKPKWEAISGPLMTLYTKAMDLNPHNRSNLEARFAVAMESADNGDYAKAIQVAQKLKPLLDDALAFGQSDQTDEIAEGTVKFQQASMLWRQTRAKMLSEMKALEDSIMTVLNQDPDLADMAKEAKELTGRLQAFDDRLENALNAITETPPGEKRKSLMKDAALAIKDYRATLDEPFFKDVDNNNGFAKVSVTATATKSLQGIAKVLTAA